MYVVVVHTILDRESAFDRGARLIAGEGAPEGTRALQFYPASDGSAVACLWESPTIESVQRYVDETLGDASSNLAFEVDSDKAFSERPLGIAQAPSISA
jgi:hypothetical protein